jgi:hypothetical protein
LFFLFCRSSVLFAHVDTCAYGDTCGLWGHVWVWIVHRLHDLPPTPTLMRAVLEVVAQAGDFTVNDMR